MAKLEIRDLNHEVEVKKHELAKIQGGATPITIPREFDGYRGNSLSLIILRKRYFCATPIEIP